MKSQNLLSFMHRFFIFKGDAFSINPRSKLAIFGGQYSSTVISLLEPGNILKSIDVKSPVKWFVVNYDWDLHSSSENERFLQSVS